MDNALYVGLSKQMTLQRQLDIAANNIANLDTAGFKVENLMLQTDPLTPQKAPRFGPVKYALDDGVARDFGQGGVEQTGGPYDFAIQGDAFFQVQTPAGPRFTRDGRFGVDTQNRLVTKDGNAVLTAEGSEITFDPRKSPPAVGKDGTISQTDEHGQVTQVGKLTVSRFADLKGLRKDGDNLFATDETPLPAADAQVRQGAVERANVKPVLEITSLIDTTRAYERVMSMMNSTSDLSRSAVQRLGKAA